MRKKNLTKAVETTVAPNPKEVDIWVEPKDDDTVSLKYYDYHDDEWVGGSDGDSSDVEEALLYFSDGTGYHYYYYPQSGKVVQLHRDGSYLNTCFAIIEEHNGFTYTTIYVNTGNNSDQFQRFKLLRTHLNNGYPLIMGTGVISYVKQHTSDIITPVDSYYATNDVLNIGIASVPGNPSEEDFPEPTYYMTISIE